jgi:hypothetical protein
VFGALLDARASTDHVADAGFMRARDGDPGQPDEFAGQGRLDLSEAELVQPARRRLWIVASEKPLEISDRHHYFFLDSVHGAPLFSRNDLFLLRTVSGRFVLFAPRLAGVPEMNIKAFCDDLASRIAIACTQPGSRSSIRELLVLSSKPGRGQGRAAISQLKRDGARTQLETVLFRLAMIPWGRGEPGTLSALGKSISEDAHPLISSLFSREYADASAAFFQRTRDAFFAHEALSSYLLAERQFDAIGMHHQSRATRQNANSVAEAVNAPLLPGFESFARPGRSISFSAERLCGFSIHLDAIPIPPNPREARRPHVYQAWGEVPLSDQSLLAALAGLASPSRRLVATAQLRGEDVTITAGLFDEMRALLRVDLDDPDHEDVAAIRVTCDSLRFVGAPWAIRPERRAVFVGRASGRHRHRVSIRATMLRGNNVYLNFEIDAGEQSLRHFN